MQFTAPTEETEQCFRNTAEDVQANDEDVIEPLDEQADFIPAERARINQMIEAYAPVIHAHEECERQDLNIKAWLPQLVGGVRAIRDPRCGKPAL